MNYGSRESGGAVARRVAVAREDGTRESLSEVEVARLIGYFPAGLLAGLRFPLNRKASTWLRWAYLNSNGTRRVCHQPPFRGNGKYNGEMSDPLHCSGWRAVPDVREPLQLGGLSTRYTQERGKGTVRPARPRFAEGPITYGRLPGRLSRLGTIKSAKRPRFSQVD